MAYRFDSYDNSLIIDGWEKGIADSPHTGLANLRNINIVSIPGEAPVNFATQRIVPPPIVVGVSSMSANVLTIPATVGLENHVAIYFTNVGSLTGITPFTPYWVANASGSPTTSFKIYSDYAQASLVSLGGSAGVATFSSFLVQVPKFFTFDNLENAYFMQDSFGQVWSNLITTPSGYWTYTGPSSPQSSSGTGLVYFRGNSAGYVFSFGEDNSVSSDLINYFNVSTKLWTWGWNPATATTHQINYLNQGGAPHDVIAAPNGTMYYTDGQVIGTIFQNVGQIFSPTNPATYTFSTFKLLPTTDVANCLSFIGTSILIGGQSNMIYTWDGISPTVDNVIILPEYNIVEMVTVQSNTFIFVGNRGRIYVSNGTNAHLFKKVPDHISGFVEPYFAWGGACSAKNQLYFGMLLYDNSDDLLAGYGGLWAIDLDTEAIRYVNQLSYGDYGGYVGALTPNFGVNPAGTGLYIGWTDAFGNSGIDTTSPTPYTGLGNGTIGAATSGIIDSDLVPIGTFNKPRDFTQIEYRLAKPLVNGESIQILARLIYNYQDTGYTSVLTAFYTPGANNYSGTGAINFLNAQWVQFQIVLNSTTSFPSYVRLKEIRILGLTGPTLTTNQQLSL